MTRADDIALTADLERKAKKKQRLMANATKRAAAERYRPAYPDRQKYRPHQGKREMARRAKRMLK